LTAYATTGYATGVSGSLQNQITALNNQTGNYYLNTNPSGFISGISNIVYATGDQSISGIKTFTAEVNISGNVGIGTTTPTAKLDVNGTANFSSDVAALGRLTVTNDIIGNSSGNILPFQNDSSPNSILTRTLADDRFSNRGVRITGNTISHNLEQFVDFVENYSNDLTISIAAGNTASGPSPAVFGDTWNPTNAGVTGFLGNDLYAHKGIYLYRGHNAGASGSIVFQLNRPTSTNLVGVITGESRLFTARLFLPSDSDFVSKGYFKIGPCQKGGSGGAAASLGGGLMFNPYASSNLIIGVFASGVGTPFTFTTGSSRINYVDTNLPYSSVAGRWVNFSYRSWMSGSSAMLDVDIVRENSTLFSTRLNINALQSASGWVNAFQLKAAGASAEIGLNFGKIGVTATRSQLFMDYIYSNVTGSYYLPTNWNSLRF
jgi:hypothetical protein